MGATVRGFPYPDPADPISGGADAIKALAERVETTMPRYSAGFVSIQVNNSNVGSVTLTHPLGRFTAVPYTVATPVNASSWFANTSSPSVNAVVISIARVPPNVTVGVVVHYVAMQAP